MHSEDETRRRKVAGSEMSIADIFRQFMHYVAQNAAKKPGVYPNKGRLHAKKLTNTTAGA